ncbi:F-box/LRR-repeat protein At3g26922-like [Hibiscus syriacus]|uniref:F-box/LRR-repeat protein At3g26922-like n=1 Tax=Hibiscus syriacus TaxID=106335 RepID=UPI0019235878|nr:F-box/LRR-repeat protein At3g26922-like [Hibiscus syriacus]
MASNRISNLPDSLLTRILSSLPIEDVVSTSILSTRWRYIEGRIKQFRLNRIDISGIDDSRVCAWIYGAIWHGVKEIDLVFALESNNIPMLPNALLFTCKTLVRLKLEIPFVMSVHIHVCLPSLKILVLRSTKFEDDDSVKTFFSGCPILEQLSIFYCDMRNIIYLTISIPSLKSLTLLLNDYPLDDHSLCLAFAIVINLPSLVYFKYVDFRAKNYLTVNMPSLVRAGIKVYGTLTFTTEVDVLVKLFEGIDKIKSLHLSINPEAMSFIFIRQY